MALTRIGTSAYSTLDATKLVGNLPSISGASLTGISAGKIVQTKMEGNINFSGDVGTSSTDFQYFGNEISITPTSSSNALIFHLHLSVHYYYYLLLNLLYLPYILKCEIKNMSLSSLFFPPIYFYT